MTLAAQQTDLIADLQTFFKAIGFTAANRTCCCCGGCIGNFLLCADRNIRHVLYIGSIGIAVCRGGAGSSLIEVSIILGQNGCNGKITEQYAQCLIMPLFVFAAGFICTGCHPENIIWIGIIAKGFVLFNRATSFAAGILITFVYIFFHSNCCRCHRVCINQSAGTNVVVVVSAVVINSIGACAACGIS